MSRDKFIIPDHGEVAWETGSKTFTRQQVFALLWTQRAMISNDIKSTVLAEDSNSLAFLGVLEILKNPRIPEF